jgi:hypothetical protein
MIFEGHILFQIGEARLYCGLAFDENKVNLNIVQFSNN